MNHLLYLIFHLFWTSCFTFPSNHLHREHNETKNSTYHRPLGFKVFNLGLPKTGSTTLQEYFLCHNFISYHHKTQGSIIGACLDTFKRNIKTEKCSVSAYKTFDALTQIDFIQWYACHIPQSVSLEWIDKNYPKSKFVLLKRPVDDWIKSVYHWGDMRERIVKCLDKKKLLQTTNTSHYEILKTFYEWHFQYVVNYFNGRPGDLIVLDLYSELIDYTLSAALGLPSKGCFTHKNMNKAIHNSNEHNQ